MNLEKLQNLTTYEVFFFGLMFVCIWVIGIVLFSIIVFMVANKRQKKLMESMRGDRNASSKKR